MLARCHIASSDTLKIQREHYESVTFLFTDIITDIITDIVSRYLDASANGLDDCDPLTGDFCGQPRT